MKKENPLLSILIPTIEGREGFFKTITNKLTYQITKDAINKVELLFYKDKRGQKTTGHKRNVLIEKAKGKFVVFVDDDDDVSSDYVFEIIKAIEDNPSVDAIGIRGVYTSTNEQTPFETSIKWSWEKTNGFYTRYINHISPIKKEIASAIKFPDKTIGEDYDYVMQLKKSKLIKTEVVIKKQIYFYDYVQNKKY